MGNVDIPYLTTVVVTDPQFPVLLSMPPGSVALPPDPNNPMFFYQNLPPGQALNFSFVVSNASSLGVTYYVQPNAFTRDGFLAQISDQAELIRDIILNSTNGLVFTTTNTQGVITTNSASLSPVMVTTLSDPAAWGNFIGLGYVAAGILESNDLANLPLPTGATLPGALGAALAGKDLAGCIHDCVANAEIDLAAATAAAAICVVVSALTCELPPVCAALIAGCLAAQATAEAAIIAHENVCINGCKRDNPPPCGSSSNGGQSLAVKSFSVGAKDDSGDGGGGGGGGCSGTECKPPPKDPNEKQSPIGFGSPAFVGVQQPWLYTIYFENVSNAQAYARQVIVNDQLDPGLDIRTFRVTEIAIGDVVITVPTNRSFYQTRIPAPAPNPTNVVIDISAGVDVQNNSVFWTLNAIDLNTGELVASVNQGVLPPDVDQHSGQGHVAYTIKPLAGTPTGTVVRNQASIVFDTNDPLDTNPTTNTVDGVLPTSSVQALPPLISSNTFLVSWMGTDDPGGSGVANYSIFFSDNRGPYQTLLANTATNSAQFAGQFGHTYAFYSTAQDNAGNVEAPHTTPDTTTTVSSLPVVTPVADQLATAGGQVVVTNSATDANVPAPTLTYSLDPSAPAGASVDTNGVFRWTPTCAQGSTTNLITIWVTASGSPPLSNSVSFFVTVAGCVDVGIGSTVVQAGQSACVPVNLLSTVGLTNLSFTLVYPTNRFNNWVVTSTNPAVGTAFVQVLDGGHSLFTFLSGAGQVLEGPVVAGSICFQALPGQSAYVPLDITAIAGTELGGSPVGNISGEPGQVVVLGIAPLLQANQGTNSTLVFTLYGIPGSNYVIQSATNLRPPVTWQPAYLFTMTNLSQIFPLNGATNRPPAQFFRAYREP
ncbi:hypothetical protein SBV1_1800001 [Verrucomicrobia bacterium]|nr:hypothetical protein SBV1_1800001 [Verrucomicrobiota bacterium]